MFGLAVNMATRTRTLLGRVWVGYLSLALLLWVHLPANADLGDSHESSDDWAPWSTLEGPGWIFLFWLWPKALVLATAFIWEIYQWLWDLSMCMPLCLSNTSANQNQGLAWWCSKLILHRQCLASHMDTSSCSCCSTSIHLPACGPLQPCGSPRRSFWFLALD